jgi:hypothetical protein
MGLDRASLRLDTYEAIAGSEGAEHYGVYFLRADATDLRTVVSAPVCARKVSYTVCRRMCPTTVAVLR